MRRNLLATIVLLLMAVVAVAQKKYELSDATCNAAKGDNSPWPFNNGFSVSENAGKTYGAGGGGIKYSAGVKYTINLPEDFRATSVTFTGYDNYGDVDAYIQECNGVTYSSTQYVYPQKTSSGDYTVATHTITLTPEATGTLTFTPAGKQVVWTITIDGIIGGSSQILMGDANLDGDISVTDIITAVSYVLGEEPEVFGFANADMDGNGEISIADITAIVDLILNKQ